MQVAIDPDTVTNVTGTAFVVAEYRAEENYAVTALPDDVVGLFLSAASRRAAAQAAAGFPLVKELVKIRTRYFDDMLERQIAAGCRQVVLLGAGLDTRAVRKAAPGVRFFEIDDAATMNLKRYVLDHHRLTADVAFIDGNDVTDGMLPLLVASGLDIDVPTFVICQATRCISTPPPIARSCASCAPGSPRPGVVRLLRAGHHHADDRRSMMTQMADNCPR
jgi:methyltransferase (TIGR00027 family)